MITVGDPIIKRGKGGIPLTDFTLPPLCASPKPGPGYLTSYDEVFFVINELR